VASVVRRLHELPASPYAPGDEVVALTFDDGPGPHTDAVLDALAEADVHATFFVLGAAVERHPGVLKRVGAAGHTIGSHSWSHTRTEALDDDTIRAEAEQVRELVTSLTRRPVTYARPPFRPQDAPRFAELLAPLGFAAAVTWSVDPRDWELRDPGGIAAATIAALHPGAIVLLHDGGGDRSATAAAVPEIVGAARALGYRFVAL
jgi:peptidoglycan/xylan/chitin deacetylase (PgdA/CDA1 family)